MSLEDFHKASAEITKLTTQARSHSTGKLIRWALKQDLPGARISKWTEGFVKTPHTRTPSHPSFYKAAKVYATKTTTELDGLSAIEKGKRVGNDYKDI